ncbi:MAG: ribosome silencing factor [Gammaproteobacteria bacterium]|jgi:ribosome-associated protein|nr:ribosome silencing factor [Gammaproteobacteria bacterium]MDP6616755.1 ribosome silencing factor [Gammaproteobacteria bacterium]MDP6695180.1 ribosome silencing factor [Gammaproteobacteria bacterium]MDP7041481.1 ribosome silencing factor [Gammaproteobacteria bacterium]
MQSEALLKLAQSSLEDLKARDIRVLDVRTLTTVTDYLLIASGTSDRHVKSMADQLIENAKFAGQPPLGIEGQEAGEWVLIDLADIVVHVMQPRTREFYKLEDLWAVGSGVAAESSGTRVP